LHYDLYLSLLLWQYFIVSTLINLSQLTTAIHTFDDAHQTFHLINTIIVPVTMPTSWAYFQYFVMCINAIWFR